MSRTSATALLFALLASPALADEARPAPAAAKTEQHAAVKPDTPEEAKAREKFHCATIGGGRKVCW